MALTKEQIEENVQALRSQNASEEDIKSYLQTVKPQKEDEPWYKEMVKDPLKTLLVRPALRAGQGIGMAAGHGLKAVGAIDDQQLQRGYDSVFEQPTRIPGLGMEVEPMKRWGEGAGAQIGGQALQAGGYLGGFGLGKAVAGPLLGKSAAGGKAYSLAERGARSMGRGARNLGIGAASGASYFGGAEMEAGGSAEDIRSEAIIGGVMGGGIAAGLGVALPPLLKGSQKAYKHFFNADKHIAQKAPAVAEKGNRQLVHGVEESFYTPITKHANNIEEAQRAVARSTSEGGPVTRQDLFNELFEAGYKPSLTGKTVPGTTWKTGELLDTSKIKIDIDDELTKFGRQLDEKLAHPSVAKTTFDAGKLSNEIIESARKDPAVKGGMFDKVAQDIEKFFNSQQSKHGTISFNPKLINEMRKEANRTTKAFGEEYSPDSLSVISRYLRKEINDLFPDGSADNILQESHKLYRMRRTADLIDNKPIDIPYWANTLGRYWGVVGAASAGVGYSGAGPGGLVLAGLTASLGAKGIALWMRNSRFGDPARVAMRKLLFERPQMLDEFKKSSPEDAKFFERESNIGSREAGRADIGTVAGVGGATAVGAGIASQVSPGEAQAPITEEEPQAGVFEQQGETGMAPTVEEETGFNREDFSNKIVFVENEQAQAGDEDLYTVKGVTGDLGKYQVKPETLKEWSEPWLGEKYTPEEFLNDPEAQERFFGEFMNVVERLNLNEEQAAIAWHRGWGELGTGKGSREERDRKFLERLNKLMEDEASQKYLERLRQSSQR